MKLMKEEKKKKNLTRYMEEVGDGAGIEAVRKEKEKGRGGKRDKEGRGNKRELTRESLRKEKLDRYRSMGIL